MSIKLIYKKYVKDIVVLGLVYGHKYLFCVVFEHLESINIILIFMIYLCNEVVVCNNSGNHIL